MNKNNNNNQREKLPRAIVMANNKKQKQINNILMLRDEMIKNSIDSTLIKKFMDEEYEKINKEFEMKIEKANTKSNSNVITKENKTKSNSNKNLNLNPSVKEIKKKREKAVEFLLKNKSFLEEHGASKEYIKKYVEKQYQEINEYYNIENFKTANADNCSDSDIECNYEQVDFID